MIGSIIGFDVAIAAFWRCQMIKWAYAYVLMLSAVAWLTMGLDKYFAIRKKYRISEFILLFLALLGGGIGTMAGMICFRHKISKTKFRVLAPLGTLTVFFVLAIITYC